MSSIEKALQLIRQYPRIALNNISKLPYRKKATRRRRGVHGGKTLGLGHKGQGQHGTLPRIGYEGGQTPFYLKVPKEPYYQGHHLRKEYPPLSLLTLQRMIDLGHLDTGAPIDLTHIVNTKLMEQMDPHKRHYGFNLTDEGADIFSAKINIEVQWASEVSIAAIERCGGSIITRFYDLPSLVSKLDPERFFKRGLPIPRCKLPTYDVAAFYLNPLNRGYLADPEKIREARLELAQKYGYVLPPGDDQTNELMGRRKDPRQIFDGLEPGWVINLRDKTILKPTDPEYIEYYQS
ncbi:large ribosomal subunit protein uL15m-like [Tubulanus polymorphus]|uniref:large ribosomal subunit protein uL15m-like n=1 Tax=Tubulanus polymorphus TaxID=672921 RepID=UPI003DA47A71